jgi:hypothetical protein
VKRVPPAKDTSAEQNYSGDAKGAQPFTEQRHECAHGSKRERQQTQEKQSALRMAPGDAGVEVAKRPASWSTMQELKIRIEHKPQN